ncbi:MAG: hypothetical protein HC871_13150, partial [Rhizobiales bacterium]|nr:hypothetical protein [Hyphomicrobiales bacterium]
AFMAIGAYSAFKLNSGVRIATESFVFLDLPAMSTVPSILFGGLMAAIVGILFGVPSLRIKGLYLAVATLAAQFFFDWVFARVKWFTNYEPSGSVSAPTMNIMGWTVDSEGLGVIFDREIPPFAERHFGPAVEGMLGRMGLSVADVGRFCCHPGGSKVIQALETALHLQRRTLDHERAVLADYGNMSAPTVLFVLERLLQAGLPERTALTALGPGFSTHCVSLKRPS